ncbi:bis(5'-nucleosyl)-tetraphosphatase (symmetrical) YqeK [bacterium]|nr:bis(5'-nucleosyl)-tetraphosphatase (symmetrical) YqeK [bacterium]
MKTDYTLISLEEIEMRLKECLSEERFEHSLGVMEKSVELAQKFGADTDKARLAGLLHDCAKCIDKSELKKMIDENNLDEDNCCAGSYKVWHAPVSAFLAQKDYGVNDKEILSAIKWHTMGRLNMTLLEKIVYLADKIEERTREIEYRVPIDKVLKETGDLDMAILKSFKMTICSLTERNLPICQTTIDVYNELLKKTTH